MPDSEELSYKVEVDSHEMSNSEALSDKVNECDSHDEMSYNEESLDYCISEAAQDEMITIEDSHADQNYGDRKIEIIDSETYVVVNQSFSDDEIEINMSDDESL
jgi:hypothetical protein